MLSSAGLSYRDVFRINSLKKYAAVWVLYTELISLPLLALQPILLNMSTAGAAQWLGISLVMHSPYGAVLGVVVGCGPGVKRDP